MVQLDDILDCLYDWIVMIELMIELVDLICYVDNWIGWCDMFVELVGDMLSRLWNFLIG